MDIHWIPRSIKVWIWTYFFQTQKGLNLGLGLTKLNGFGSDQRNPIKTLSIDMLKGEDA